MARGKVFQILVPGDPKGALVLAVLASGILEDPGAEGGESLNRRKHMAQKKSKERPYFSARFDFPLPPLSAHGSPRMS